MTEQTAVGVTDATATIERTTSRAADHVTDQRGVSVRAVTLGTILAIVNTVWVTEVEVRYYILDGSCLPLFITPVFLLLLLVAGNALVRRVSPPAAFTQSEMLVAYLMAVISNTFAGHDMLQNFFGSVTHPFYFAPQNGWQDTFLDRLPKFLYVTDEDALKGWYRGNIGPAQANGYLVHWIVPLTLWGGFFLTLVLLFLCITLVVRKAWTENERLAFPIIQLPVAMTEPSATLFRQPLMWLGFGVAFALSGFNGIHELYPAVPNMPWLKLYDVGQFFTTQPLEAIRSYGMQTSLYPFAIGLAYFIPLDLAFSCWFSYLLARVYFVFGRATGLDGPSAAQGWPFLKEISSGAWIGVAAAILYQNRRHLVNAFNIAFDKGPDGARLRAEDPAEAKRQRFALLGILVSGLLLFGWSKFLLNMSVGATAGFFGILIALSLAITRVRAEFGTPHEIVFVKPADTLVTLLGTKTIGDANLIGMQTMYWFNRGYRCHPIPNFLEGFKMTEGRERAMPLRRLVGMFALASIVSLLATYVSNYYITYDAGAAGKANGYKQWVGQEAFGQLGGWLSYGQRAGATNLYFFLGGLATVAALAALRANFLWWPLHPAGFALGISYAMNYFWLCVFVAWMVKGFLVRYGGMTAHRRAIPFFLGLVLGDYTAGALWSLLSLLLGMPTYKIFI